MQRNFFKQRKSKGEKCKEDANFMDEEQGGCYFVSKRQEGCSTPLKLSRINSANAFCETLL